MGKTRKTCCHSPFLGQENLPFEKCLLSTNHARLPLINLSLFRDTHTHTHTHTHAISLPASEAGHSATLYAACPPTSALVNGISTVQQSLRQILEIRYAELADIPRSEFRPRRLHVGQFLPLAKNSTLKVDLSSAKSTRFPISAPVAHHLTSAWVRLRSSSPSAAAAASRMISSREFCFNHINSTGANLSTEAALPSPPAEGTMPGLLVDGHSLHPTSGPDQSHFQPVQSFFSVAGRARTPPDRPLHLDLPTYHEQVGVSLPSVTANTNRVYHVPVTTSYHPTPTDPTSKCPLLCCASSTHQLETRSPSRRRMSVDHRPPRITTSFQEALSDGYVELVMPPYVFQDHAHAGQAYLDQSMLHHDNPFYPPGVMNNRTYPSAVNVIPAENLNLYHQVPLPCVAYDVSSARRPSTTSTVSSISTDFDTQSPCGNANMKSIPFNQPMMTPANTPIASPLIDGPSDARAFPYPRTSDSTTTTPPLRNIKVKLAEIGNTTSTSFGVDTGINHCDAPPLGMNGSGEDVAGGESVKKPQHPCEICGKTFTRAYNLREHHQVHSAIRARTFNCGTCPRAYFRRADLRRHQKALGHSGNRASPIPAAPNVLEGRKHSSSNVADERSRFPCTMQEPRLM